MDYIATTPMLIPPSNLTPSLASVYDPQSNTLAPSAAPPTGGSQPLDNVTSQLLRQDIFGNPSLAAQIMHELAEYLTGLQDPYDFGGFSHVGMIDLTQLSRLLLSRAQMLSTETFSPVRVLKCDSKPAVTQAMKDVAMFLSHGVESPFLPPLGIQRSLVHYLFLIAHTNETNGKASVVRFNDHDTLGAGDYTLPTVNKNAPLTSFPFPSASIAEPPVEQHGPNIVATTPATLLPTPGSNAAGDIHANYGKGKRAVSFRGDTAFTAPSSNEYQGPQHNVFTGPRSYQHPSYVGCTTPRPIQRVFTPHQTPMQRPGLRPRYSSFGRPVPKPRHSYGPQLDRRLPSYSMLSQRPPLTPRGSSTFVTANPYEAKIKELEALVGRLSARLEDWGPTKEPTGSPKSMVPTTQPPKSPPGSSSIKVENGNDESKEGVRTTDTLRGDRDDCVITTSSSNGEATTSANDQIQERSSSSEDAEAILIAVRPAAGTDEDISKMI